MAVDYYLELATVQGESKDTKHTNQIQVQSWSWGASQTSTVSATTGSGAGKVSLSDLSLMIEFDKASPKLFAGICLGTHYATAKLSAVKSGAAGADYMTLSLAEVFITSLQFSASSEVPSVSLSLTYKSFQMDYFMQDAEGTVSNAGTAKWDVTTNTDK